MSSEDYRLDSVACHALLQQRLIEPAPGRIQLLCGPRQVGKTTLLLQLAQELGESALYIAADGPEAALPGFWQRFWSRAEQLAASLGRAVVLLDEVHLIERWAEQLKGEWDRLKRRNIPLHIVATGSSALRLTVGSRESLAGRFERMTLSHWTAKSLMTHFALSEIEAVDHVILRGAYPGTLAYENEPQRWAAYVHDAIVEPAIGRDLLALAAIRRPALLRQLFAVCTASPAQIVSLQKLQGQLQDPGALETIAHYLNLLEEAYLVAPIAKFSLQPARRRAAPPKLVALSNALLAATDPRGIPGVVAAEPQRFGAWLENACLAHAWNAGQALTYWREEPYEVDAILDGSWGPWAIEIKSGALSSTDFNGLLEFTRRHPRYQPLVLCDTQSIPVVERLGLAAMSWRRFLLDDLRIPPSSLT